MTVYQLRLIFVLVAIVALVAGKPPPPPDAPWAKFVAKPGKLEYKIKKKKNTQA